MQVTGVFKDTAGGDLTGVNMVLRCGKQSQIANNIFELTVNFYPLRNWQDLPHTNSKQTDECVSG